MGWEETSQGLWDPPSSAGTDRWVLSFHPRFFLKFFLKCNQNCLKNAGNPRDMRRFQVSTRCPPPNPAPHTRATGGDEVGDLLCFTKGLEGNSQTGIKSLIPLSPFANPNSPWTPLQILICKP